MILEQLFFIRVHEHFAAKKIQRVACYMGMPSLRSPSSSSNSSSVQFESDPDNISNYDPNNISNYDILLHVLSRLRITPQGNTS